MTTHPFHDSTATTAAARLLNLIGPPLLYFHHEWTPCCWSVAVIRLHGPLPDLDENPEAVIPECWAWFVWQPSTTPLAGRLPTGWGHTGDEPFDVLCGVVKGRLLYQLEEHEIDWTGLLILLELDIDEASPTWGHLVKLQLRKKWERLAWVSARYRFSPSDNEGGDDDH